MRRFMVGVLVGVGALVAVFAAPGCNSSKGGGSNTNPNPSAQTWGVMAYVMGRNENATGALNALNQVQGTNASANVIVEAAFSTIDLSSPPFTTTQELTVSGGAGKLRTDRGSQAMDDANECARFLTDAIPYTNAQRHLLIVHGHHGGPAFLVGADTLAATSSFDLAALDTALTSARTAANLARFDIIVLDMPESATFETVAICAKHASFLVAIEGGVPSPGFSETVVANQLKANPNIDATSLATAIAQSLSTQTSGTPEASDVSAVSVNLAQAAGLLSALQSFAASLQSDVNAAAATATTGAIAAVASARRDAIELDIPFKTEVVDAASFVAQLAAVASAGTTGGISPGTVSLGASLTAAISGSFTTPAAVGSNVLGAGGLGIYFPHCQTKFSSGYAASSAALSSSVPAWLGFLNAYTAKLATASQPPVVTTVNAPATIVHDQLFTVTASMTPVNTIQDVTLLVTVNLNGSDTVVFSTPLGPPDVNGGVAFTGTASFVSVNGGAAVTSALFVPLQRQVRGKALVFAFEADMQYTNATGSVLRDGFVKVEPIAGVPSGGLGAYTWTAIANPGANLARSSLCVSSGTTFTVFPRVFTVGSNGVQSSLRQTATGFVLTSSGISSIGVNARTSTGGILGPAKVWIIAEGVNGEISPNFMNVSIQ